MRVIQGEQPRVVSSEAKPEPQPEEEHKQAANIGSACFQACMHCKMEAVSFCASCGGDLCAEHDSAAHSAADTSPALHARVPQSDKIELLQALAGGSASAFSKSVESRKLEVQAVVCTLAEVEANLKLETKGHQGQSHKGSRSALLCSKTSPHH